MITPPVLRLAELRRTPWYRSPYFWRGVEKGLAQGMILGLPFLLWAFATAPSSALGPPSPRTHRAYLPMVARLAAFRPDRPTATVSATATARATARATAVSDWRTWEKNMLTPNAVVVLTGEHCPSRVIHMERGVRLEATGARLTCRGLYLNRADGAIIRGLTVGHVTGDGIQVTHSRDVLIEGVNISGTGDGGLDLVETHDDGKLSWITVKDSIIHDTAKGSLIGDQDQPQDALLRVRLIRVQFIRIRERGPKVQRAVVWIEGGRVDTWIGTAVDARLGATIFLKNTSFQAGDNSAAHLQTSFGGRIIDEGGNTFSPWPGRQ